MKIKPAFHYIFVSGGVISGIGKGVTAASIGFLLKSAGYRVAILKCDAYVNIDAGTIRPQEHGEVFVTEDGIETDQDLGHYERFLHTNLSRANYATTGQIYQAIIRKERNFDYQGEDVEVVPHVPEEIIRRIKEAGRSARADVVIVEIGGTVGEYQNVLFLEANRILKYREKEPVAHVHVAYLPTPKHLGEMKSKPVQTSVRLLNESMIQPDFIVGRAVKALDRPRIERLALFCNIDADHIISAPYTDSIYEMPIIFRKQQFDRKIRQFFHLPPPSRPASTIISFANWSKKVTTAQKIRRTFKICIVGKYQKIGDYTLPDAYVCVLESLRHAGWERKVRPVIEWLDAEALEKNPRLVAKLQSSQGLIVPQGWGNRGTEGKITAIRYVRENRIPYLGLCFGMQMALIEYGRNRLGLTAANSTEVNHRTSYPVIDIMPHQKEYLKKHQYGGTIRLGAWPCVLREGSMLRRLYTDSPVLDQYRISLSPLTVMERHRHRYEFNLAYRARYLRRGMVFSGLSPDGQLVEAIELPQSEHPFFIGVQYHPEYKSRLLAPHPLFVGFVDACLAYQRRTGS